MIKRKNNLFFTLLLITIFINVTIPKAGFKIAGIPITLSNIFVLIIYIAFFIRYKFNFKCRYKKILIISIIYFFIRSVLSLVLVRNISVFASYVVPMSVYPLIVFVLLQEVNTKEKLDQVEKTITIGLIIVFIYGILQFLLGIEKVCIPGVTVNISDYLEYGPQWYLEKYNGISNGGSKIVSTYQNGNVMGVSITLLAPIGYKFFSDRRNKLALFLFVGLFTIVNLLSLSRTAWLGLIVFYLIIWLKYKPKTVICSFLKIISPLALLMVLIVMTYKIPAINERMSAVFSKEVFKLSGRTDIVVRFFNSVKYNPLFYILSLIGIDGIVPYEIFVYEMTYISIFILYGVFGVIIYIVTLVDFVLKRKNHCHWSYKTAIICFMAMALLDGCYWLPPTALSVFMVVGLAMVYSKLRKQVEKKVL